MLTNSIRGVAYWRQRQKEEPDSRWPPIFAEEEESILRELIALREQPRYAAMWEEVRETLHSLPGARELMRSLGGKSNDKPVAYVDELRDYKEMVSGKARRWGTVWSHLSCGGDCQALIEFAQRLGLKPEYAQHMDKTDHYFHHFDLTPAKRERALKLGAVFKPIRDQASEYLRRQKAIRQ